MGTTVEIETQAPTPRKIEELVSFFSTEIWNPKIIALTITMQ